MHAGRCRHRHRNCVGVAKWNRIAPSTQDSNTAAHFPGVVSGDGTAGHAEFRADDTIVTGCLLRTSQNSNGAADHTRIGGIRGIFALQKLSAAITDRAPVDLDQGIVGGKHSTAGTVACPNTIIGITAFDETILNDAAVHDELASIDCGDCAAIADTASVNAAVGNGTAVHVEGRFLIQSHRAAEIVVVNRVLQCCAVIHIQYAVLVDH